MKILLLGNHILQKTQSMRRFANLLHDVLTMEGIDVRVLEPSTIISRLWRSERDISRWVRYFDQFLIFLPYLKKAVAGVDLVHICDQANAVYLPWIRNKANLVTCHDLLAAKSALGEIPEHSTRWAGCYYQKWILRNLSMAQHIVCDSRQTYADVLRLTALSEEQVSVAPVTLNYPYSPMDSAEAAITLDRLGLSKARRFFLHVGSNAWYKNRKGVVSIFAHLSRTPAFGGFHLFLAGDGLTQELRSQIHQMGVAGRVHEIPQPSNEVLRALYSSAEALLFPSWCEGFGWPIIEAQACGCPVVTSNRQPMIEVAGSFAIYIDPADEISSAQKIADGLRLRAETIRGGFSNAARFSRDEFAAGYLRAYRKCLSMEASCNG